ncbi:MAG TPA: hypothetical protein DDW52_24040 [Planctomycetaceae bacterium]|nr:hypothetical protein [Planctomycetaceae bacterium]
MLIALAVAALGIALPKMVVVEADPQIWFFSWLGGCSAVGLLTSIVLSFVGRPGLAESAAEVDRRFGLRERLSSALSMPQQDRQSALGEALKSDAERRAETLVVSEHFSFGISGKLLLPLAPALLALALTQLADREPEAKEPQLAQLNIKKVKESTDALMKKIQQQRKRAEEKGLRAAVDMFKKLEGELAKLRKNEKMDTKQALTKLNDIKKQLEDRRKEIGGANELKKHLQSLSKFEPGPLDDLADSMKKGDMEKAEDALEKLLEKLKSGEMNESDMAQMQKQMDALQKAMEEAAQKHQEAKDAVQQQIDQAKASGDQQKAAQLERKLERMQAADASMAQMQQMADMLQQASDSMSEGDMQAAQEAFEQMAQQLSEMNDADAELQDLDQLMQELSQSKSDMMGGLASNGMQGQSGNGNGNGNGDGQGSGDRAEEEDDVDFYDSRVREQMRLGETIMGGAVGGENKKNGSKLDVQEAILSSMAEEPEPLNDVPLPRVRRDHTRGYFDAVREK